MADIKSAYDFVTEHATNTGKNKYSITKTQYFDYMTSQGLSKDIIEKYNTVHADLMNGVDQFNTDKVSELVKDKAGDGKVAVKDVANDDYKVQTSVVTAAGTLKVVNRAARVSTTPATFGNKSGEVKTTIKVNPVTIDWDVKSGLNKEARASLEDDIRAFLKLDED